MNIYTATEQAYKNGYAKDYKDGMRIEPCHMCDNAKINKDLADDNDYSACSVGSYDKDCRMMLTSGWNKPLRIEVERWNNTANQWENIGIYYPKYCPNCGREVVEYKNDYTVFRQKIE